MAKKKNPKNPPHQNKYANLKGRLKQKKMTPERVAREAAAKEAHAEFLIKEKEREKEWERRRFEEEKEVRRNRSHFQPNTARRGPLNLY